jgi:photosystem I reaction center subunit VIII
MSSILPSLLVPIIGVIFPAIAMSSLFLYIEKDELE